MNKPAATTTIGYLMAYCVNNLYSVAVLPSIVAGLALGCLAYALYTGRPERGTRLG